MNCLPPPADYGEFCCRVRDLCAGHSLSITGGGRTAIRNSAKGGHPNSKHKWSRGGYAFDCVPDDNYQAEAEVCAAARKLGLAILVHKGTAKHYHIQATGVGLPTPGEIE